LQEVYTEALWLISTGDAPLDSPPPDPQGRKTADTFQ
jgi:hypothetical protein